MYLLIIDLMVRFLLVHDHETISIRGHLAFGFLGGKEVRAAKIGNIGLRDRTPVDYAYIVVLILTIQRAFRIGMGSKTYCCLQRRP